MCEEGLVGSALAPGHRGLGRQQLIRLDLCQQAKAYCGKRLRRRRMDAVTVNAAGQLQNPILRPAWHRATMGRIDHVRLAGVVDEPVSLPQVLVGARGSHAAGAQLGDDIGRALDGRALVVRQDYTGRVALGGHHALGETAHDGQPCGVDVHQAQLAQGKGTSARQEAADQLGRAG